MKRSRRESSPPVSLTAKQNKVSKTRKRRGSRQRMPDRRLSLGEISHPCYEYFHSPTSTPTITIACAGRHHTEPYHICLKCTTKCRTWELKRQRDSRMGNDTNVIRSKRYKKMCMPCTTAASADPERDGNGCRCDDIWLCFECSDVISWRGQVDKMDMLRLERRKREKVSQGAQSFNACPGCEELFEFRVEEAKEHASMCMACKGIFCPFVEQTSETSDAMEDSTQPSLQSPSQSGYPPHLRRMAIIEENVAPDADSTKVLLTENATNDASASSIAGGRILDWNFPRSPYVKIGPPVPGANGVTDAEVRNVLREYVDQDHKVCWICGSPKHQCYQCPELMTESEGARMIKHLLDTKASDRVREFLHGKV